MPCLAAFLVEDGCFAEFGLERKIAIGLVHAGVTFSLIILIIEQIVFMLSSPTTSLKMQKVLRTSDN